MSNRARLATARRNQKGHELYWKSSATTEARRRQRRSLSKVSRMRRTGDRNDGRSKVKQSRCMKAAGGIAGSTAAGEESHPTRKSIPPGPDVLQVPRRSHDRTHRDRTIVKRTGPRSRQAYFAPGCGLFITSVDQSRPRNVEQRRFPIARQEQARETQHSQNRWNGMRYHSRSRPH